jgi:hypothetical protein
MNVPACVRALVLTTALSLGAAPVGAQSLFNAAGLGLPVASIDGRGRALGNLGIGLWGHSILPTDPGAAGMLIIPSGVLVAQPSWVEFERGSDDAGRFQGNRFPFIGISYPLFSGMFTAGFGSFLDQRFNSQRNVTVDLVGGASDATDIFEQDGAVTRVSIGFSRRLSDQLGVGVTLGRYAGSVTRQLMRDFSAGTLTEDFTEYEAGGRWSYSGASVTGGFAADLGTVARVAGSATWSSSLNATGSEDTEGSDRDFDLPLQFRLGTTVVLAPGLLVTASAVRADWEGLADDLSTPSNVGSTNGFGVGVELSRMRLLGLSTPLRFGYRRSSLPFSFGSGGATEKALSGGFGFVLAETNGITLAGVDFAVERGERSDSSLTERFWRGTVSLSVSGF